MSSSFMAVGRYGLNHRNDVLRVQQLLNTALQANPSFKASGIAPLNEDGKCGTKTIGAIEQYQRTVLKWSGPAVDATIHPDRTTWKSLNGNVLAVRHVRKIVTPAYMWRPEPIAVAAPPKQAALPKSAVASASSSGPAAFRQGDYKESLGFGGKVGKKKVPATISNVGCALCTLTMAATYIGSRTEHWPAKLQPKDLTPSLANEILRKGGAFDGYALRVVEGAKILGMRGSEFGRGGPLPSDAVKRLENHLTATHFVAAHVDYKGEGAAGDHWVLITARNGDRYTAIDPATGRSFILTQKPDNGVTRTRDTTGVLYGAEGTLNQQAYVVVRFVLLSPSK